jgi:hypothetical protein
MNRIALRLKQASRTIYASLPPQIRALHAITRIAGIQKRAMSVNDINRVVEHSLKMNEQIQILVRDGHKIPNIRWGSVFHAAVKSVARQHKWSRTQIETYLNDVVGDMVMGQSILGLRDRGLWKHNLATQIAEWMKDGKSDSEIGKLLTRWVQDKASNLAKRDRAQTGPATTSFEPGAPSEEQQKTREIFENLFVMDGLSSGQMAGYRSLLRTNHEARQLVERIHKVLGRRDEEMGHIWEAYMSNPSGSLRDVLKEEVHTTIAGRRTKVPLWEALGFEEGAAQNAGKLLYKVRKLRSWLKKQWPDVEDVVQGIG